MSYRPSFVLINLKEGSLVGVGTEEDCRTQLKEISDGSSAAKGDPYLLAEVKVLSEMKRVET